MTTTPAPPPPPPPPPPEGQPAQGQPQPQPPPYPAGGYGKPTGPIGPQRSIGKQIGLSIITLGFYGIYWAYYSFEEIKQHTGEGVGGVVGAVIQAFVGVVNLFLLPIEIRNMYQRDGQESPVGPATAFWILLFAIPWYVKCQAALNQYWASKGAPAPA